MVREGSETEERGAPETLPPPLTPSLLPLPSLLPIPQKPTTHVLSPSSLTLLASASVQEKMTEPMEMNRKRAMP